MKEKYQLVYRQVKAMVSKESDPIANMANVAALLHETFGWWWTGFIVWMGRVRAGSFPGSGSLHKDSIWVRSLRYSMENG